MHTDSKIYHVLKRPFSSRKDNLGNKISNNVNTIVQELQNQNMNKEELTALKSCYEAVYQDSMGSLQVIVSLLVFFAGIDIVSDLSVLGEIRFFVKLAFLLLWLLYSCYKIHKLSKESASLRNHIMAVSILLTENK